MSKRIRKPALDPIQGDLFATASMARLVVSVADNGTVSYRQGVKAGEYGDKVKTLTKRYWREWFTVNNVKYIGNFRSE